MRFVKRVSDIDIYSARGWWLYSRILRQCRLITSARKCNAVREATFLFDLAFGGHVSRSYRDRKNAGRKKISLNDCEIMLEMFRLSIYMHFAHRSGNIW